MAGLDVEYVWQRRIYSGTKYRRTAVPFPDCAAIGLEFNVASKRTKKLDLDLMTNGVVLDICDFAKAVSKGEKYFMFEILEYNFDLGFENDNQRYEFATRVLQRAKIMKDKTKTKPRRFQETFWLPDPKTMVMYGGYYGQLQESELSRMNVDAENPTPPENPSPSESHTPSENPVPSENPTSSESIKTDPNGKVTEVLTRHKQRGAEVKLSDLYPLCKTIGLDLVMRVEGKPKPKLCQDALTKGMMIEIIDFVKQLSGNWSQIVLDVLEHNFEVDLHSDKANAKLSISKLLEKRNMGLIGERRVRFRQEVFSLQSKKPGKTWKRRWLDHSVTLLATKRQPKPKLREDFTSSQKEDHWQDYNDMSYTFPVEELDPAEQWMTTEIRCSSEITNGMEPATLLHIKQEEEEIALSTSVPCWEDSAFHQQPYAAGSNDEARRHILDPFSLDMTKGVIKVEPGVRDAETDHKNMLWRRRSPRSQRILSKTYKVNDSYVHCRKAGVDFNMGSVAKQNLNLQLLTNGVLLEVSKFASMITKSQGHYMLDILERNFPLRLQNEVTRRSFLLYFFQKVKIVMGQVAKAKADFLIKVFEVPEVYNEVDVTCDFPSTRDILMERRHSGDLPSAATTQNTSMELHPFCKEIGLDLWGVEERPTNEKLDLSLLTNRVAIEVFNFAKELCGSVWAIVCDVLEHNFDLHLQGGKTKVGMIIHRCHLSQKRLRTKKPYWSTVRGLEKWSNAVVRLKVGSRGKAAVSGAKLKSSRPNKNGLKRATEKRRFELDRRKDLLTYEEPPAKTVKYNEYPLCQEIGVDLNIKSKSEVKPKLDLKVLTRAVLYEMHTFIEKHYRPSYVSTLYEILRYNFDLSSENHQRLQFALSVGSQVKAMAGRYRHCLSKRGEYPNRVFELPFDVTGPEQTSGQIACKDEPIEIHIDLDYLDDDVLFVKKLIPFDIEVELD